MSDENDTNRLTEDDGSLAGDALLRAVRRDMLGLFKALDQTVIAEQENHGRRLDAIEGKLGRLDVIEGELRQLRGRNERMIGQLSRNVVEVRAAQHDLEDRPEKLEKTPT